MKDKIFFPAVVATLVFLIIFLLICIINQTSISKNLTQKLEVLAYKIENSSSSRIGKQGEISGMQAGQILSKAELAKMSPGMIALKAEVMNLVTEVMKLQKEVNKLKADIQSHGHRNKKVIFVESVDKGK